MNSYEVLRRAAEPIGVKALAARLKLSPAMVYKWCQESNKDDPDSSGARNPLDRIAEIYNATESLDVINWLCHEADGFFVNNPKPKSDDIDTELLRNTHQLVTEFSNLLTTVTQSIEDDGMIEPTEADHIRQAWETLKLTAESFTVACERGAYFLAEEKKEQ
ncbi:MAG: hypothetical protein GXP29_14975 [Planctomycetes bacterium]|nr:hypothetical protein [Planctomycetota bacterium]